MTANVPLEKAFLMTQMCAWNMMQNDETFQNVGMGEKKMKEVQEKIKGQVTAYEDLIKLKQKKDGGMTLKDALFKAAGSMGSGTTRTEEQNQNMKISKIVGNIKEQDDEDSTDISSDIKGLNEDEIILEQDQDYNPL